MSLKQESKRAGGDPVRQAYLSRVRGWFRDVLESRISRVVRLASADASAPTRALQPEESLLYEELKSKISSWRREMRGLGEN
jgi:DNA replication initiation complex subunit (GINS family)